jgi:hypothetical protein
MFEGTDLMLNTDSVPTNISFKSFKTYNLPTQNSYCDDRNFDSVNHAALTVCTGGIDQYTTVWYFFVFSQVPIDILYTLDSASNYSAIQKSKPWLQTQDIPMKWEDSYVFYFFNWELKH